MCVLYLSYYNFKCFHFTSHYSLFERLVFNATYRPHSQLLNHFFHFGILSNVAVS